MLDSGKKKKPRRRERRWKLPSPPRLPLPDLKDVFLFGGIGSAGYGIYQIYPPSAYIVVGGCFIALGLLIYMGGSKNGTS